MNGKATPAPLEPPPSERPLVDLWAGCATALIFYVEYLGLGSLLGSAVLPGMPNGAALGAMLVMVPVVAACLFGLTSRGAALAGPRAASTSLSAALLLLIVGAYDAAESARTALLSVMVVTASLTLLIGRFDAVTVKVRRAPVWLVQGFLYATALGIIAGSASAGRLMQCLRVDALATWLAWLLPVLLGIAWKPVLGRLHAHARQQGVRPERAHALILAQPMGLLVASACSWLIYSHSRLATPSNGLCGPFGDLRMDWGLLLSRMESISGQIESIPLEAVVVAAFCGVVIGLVLVLESLTAFSLNAKLPAYAKCQTRMLAAAAAGGLVAAGVGSVGPSFSTSRTSTLRMMGGWGRWAAPAHGLALLGIAIFAASWVAHIPKLTAAVALTLVGVQMLTSETEILWRHGYRPDAVSPRRTAVVLFWLVLAVSLATNNALMGFVILGAGASMFAFARDRRRKRQQRVSPMS